MDMLKIEDRGHFRTLRSGHAKGRDAEIELFELLDLGPQRLVGWRPERPGPPL